MSSIAKALFSNGTEANARPPVNPSPIKLPPPPKIAIPKPPPPPAPTPPPPTQSGADAQQASADAKLQARRRGGILQTTVAGETGTGGKRQILG